MTKIKCSCGKKAVWIYGPSSDHMKPEDRYCCDKCVPRGCSCNWDVKPGIKYILDEFDNIINPEEDLYEVTDEDGLYYPCCEWLYDKDGFEKENEL